MKVISIGSDRNLFLKSSAVQKRIIKYGMSVKELHIIIFACKSLGLKPQKISNTVWIYPTNSKNRLWYVFDAYKIAKQIVCDKLFMLHDGLITCQDPFETGIVGYFIAKKFHIPLQLQVHTSYFTGWFAHESFLDKIRVMYAPFLLSRATQVRVVSVRAKKSLITRFHIPQSHIDILPVFVDTKRIISAPVRINIHEKYPQFDFIILMAGRFVKQKNIILAFDAMRELVQRYPNTGLVIVGGGPEKKTYQSYIAQHHLSTHVMMEPWNNDLISYYKTADIFLLTSNHEGSPMTVIEAQAAGLPCVMTDVGAAGESLIHKKNVLITPVGELSPIVEALISIREKKIILQVGIENSIERKEYLKIYQVLWKKCIQNYSS